MSFRTAAILIIAAAGLSSCGTEIIIEPLSSGTGSLRTVVFNVCEEQGAYPTLWTGDGAAVELTLNYTGAAAVPVVPSEDSRTAAFTAKIDASGTQAPYSFYVLSPASAVRALSPSRKAWSVRIAPVQTPREGCADEAAQIMAAATRPYDEVPESVEIRFKHFTAYGRMSFKNLELDGAAVSRVELTAAAPFVGDWYCECAENHQLIDNGASSTLTLLTSRTSDICFACAPVDMSGKLLKFTVFTDKGSLYKEVLLPEGSSFSAGSIAVFDVDMSGVSLSGGSASISEDPLTENCGYGCYLNTNTRVYAPGTDQYSRSCSADGVQTFTILDPATREQLEISGYKKSLVKGDNVVVNVKWRKGRNHIIANGNYSLRVVKEEGSKVWLGNGSGQGFIIKKLF